MSVEVTALGAPMLAAKTRGVPEISNSPEIGRRVSDVTPAGRVFGPAEHFAGPVAGSNSRGASGADSGRTALSRILTTQWRRFRGAGREIAGVAS